MEKACLYVRVSSEEQSKEGVSLDAQELRVRAYAAMRGLEVAAVYREEGVSGKVELKNRPEGSKMVEALARKKAQHVVAVKLDRLFRNAADALTQSERWDKAKCALHVLDMGGSTVDTASAMGRMFFTLAAAFAEMERNVTSERTKVALRHLKAKGEAYCHLTPFGFKRTGDSLLVDHVEMATVNRIRELRGAGLSLGKIAGVLNTAGTPTKRGGAWHPVTVQKILRIHS